MPTDLSIRYDFNHLPISPRRIKLLSDWLLKQCGVGEHTVSILLVDDKRISQLNSQYRNKDKPTNVLSFPFSEGTELWPDSVPVKELGDIVISVDTALSESVEYGQSFHYRISWLLIHGMLHLLGYDHEKSARQATVMFSKEEELLNKLHFHRKTMMTRLAINVDHIATIREAKGTSEPDPVAAAAICELAGASGIVAHLREDRLHVQERDIFLLRQTVKTRINLKIGASKDSVKIALALKPDLITLVPENQQELTAEGGLDVISEKKKIAKTVERFSRKDIPVSILTGPVPKQLKAARDAGATFIELHTGSYCGAADNKAQEREYHLLETATENAYHYGLRVFAGHGLNYNNTAPVAALEGIEELSVGHAIISRAVFTGLERAVKEMLAIINRAALSV